MNHGNPVIIWYEEPLSGTSLPWTVNASCFCVLCKISGVLSSYVGIGTLCCTFRARRSALSWAEKDSILKHPLRNAIPRRYWWARLINGSIASTLVWFRAFTQAIVALTVRPFVSYMPWQKIQNFFSQEPLIRSCFTTSEWSWEFNPLIVVRFSDFLRFDFSQPLHLMLKTLTGFRSST